MTSPQSVRPTAARIPPLAAGSPEMAARSFSAKRGAALNVSKTLANHSDVEIAALTQDPESGPWSDDERTLLVMADELAEDDCVTDETWGRLTRRWQKPELVELVLLADFYRMVSGALNTFGVELEADVPGWP